MQSPRQAGQRVRAGRPEGGGRRRRVSDAARTKITSGPKLIMVGERRKARCATGGRSRCLQLVLILGSLSAFGPLTIDVYLPTMPGMATEWGIGPGQVQLTLSSFMIGLAVGQVVTGPLSDAWGRRRPLIAGLVPPRCACCWTSLEWGRVCSSEQPQSVMVHSGVVGTGGVRSGRGG